jgi:hypothetical protein
VDNTVWLTFFVANSLFESEVADRIFHTVFSSLSDLEAVLALVPVDVCLTFPFAIFLLSPEPELVVVCYYVGGSHHYLHLYAKCVLRNYH